CPWMYTGALENRPEVVDAIARERSLWGNDAACLRRVRDPFALAATLAAAGVACAGVRKPGDSPPGQWVMKPVAMAGGVGIRSIAGKSAGPTRRRAPRRDAARRVYLQEFIEGESRAGVFVADHAGCRLLGVTRQLVGESWAHAPAFRYSGSVGPLELTSTE